MSLSIQKADEFIHFVLGNKYVTPVTISVLGGVATVTSVAHGLSVGGFVQIMFAVPDGLRGDKVILATPTDDTFTYDATGIPDGAATGTISYFAGLVKVFQGKQDEASASKPAISYRIMNSQALGQNAEYYEDQGATLDETVEEKQIKILEVQFYTKTEQQAVDPLETAKDLKLSQYISANDLAAKFKINANRPRSRAFQKTNNFSVLGVTIIQDIDKTLGDRWERRALCELRIHDTTLITETVDFYDPANLQVDLNIEGL
jgi:hypothetical protein